MRYASRRKEADQTALEVYAGLRGGGAAHERALNQAIVGWLGLCPWADGREARQRVREVLLRARTMAPRNYDDWVIVAAGSELWGAGAPVAIHELSVRCRALDIGDRPSADAMYFEAVGADVLRDYLRTELPRKVSRLKRLARELLPVGRAGEPERVASD
jgi:hypothetical protein